MKKTFALVRECTGVSVAVYRTVCISVNTTHNLMRVSVLTI